MRPAAARDALVECLLAVAEERPRLAALVPRIDRSFLALARAHGVAEAAAHALSAPELAPTLPAAASAALRRAAEDAAARNALLLRDAAWLQGALAAEGIPSVALKGTALLAAHYPGLAARHVADLDLLVAPADLTRASSLLRERLGLFRPRDLGYRGAPVPDRAPGHHLPALLTPVGTVLELHQALPGHGRGAIDAEGVLARSRDAAHGGRTLRIPSPDDLLAIACQHVLAAHGADRRFRPRHLCDLAVLTATGATFDGARTLTPDTGEIDASEALLASARTGVTEGLFSRPGDGVRRRLAALTAPPAREAGSLWRKVFPARAFLAARYGARADAAWLPALWLWRPIRAAVHVVLGR